MRQLFTPWTRAEVREALVVAVATVVVTLLMIGVYDAMTH